MFVPTWRLVCLTAGGAVVVLPAVWYGSLVPLALAYGLLLTVLCLADAGLTISAQQIRVERLLPSSLSRGVPATVRLLVSNDSAQPLHAVVHDEVADELGPAGEPSPIRVGAGERAEATYSLLPTARGKQALGGVSLRWRSRWGWLERQARWDLSREVRVYPDLRAVQRGDLLAQAGRWFAAGLRTARLRGAGTEFESLREYQADDDYRRIHWGATARRGRLVSRQYEVERSQTVLLCLDAGRLMTMPLGERTRLDHAIDALLLLAAVAVQLHDRVGLLVFAEEPLVYVPPAGGRGQVTRLLEATYALSGRLVEPDYAAAWRLLGLRQRKRSLVVVFSDVVDAASSAVLLECALSLRPAHLPIFCAFTDPATSAMACSPPVDGADVYRRALAADWLAERGRTLGRLQAGGVAIVEAPPSQVAALLIRRYVEAKVTLTL